jgi:PAS domain S-box-containing protein
VQILYVEDNQLDADIIKREFERTSPGISIECVATYGEAIAKLGRCTADNPHYDLVLTDMKLPDGNGLALIPFIRDRLLPISIVVITGVGNEETAVAALKAGASDYVVKSKDYLARLPVILANSLNRFHAEFARLSRTLHVLYAEWDAVDIDLTRRHLVKYAPYISLEIVGTAQEILYRLSTDCKSSTKDGQLCDVLLLDFHLPGMSGLELLKELNETSRLDLPVVIITGYGDEEVALQAMRLGAMDYVVKNEGYLFHLPIVIENAFHRAQTASGQKALEASEKHFRLLIENVSDIIFELDSVGKIRYVSPSVRHVLGFAPDELLGGNYLELVLRDDQPHFSNALARIVHSPGIASPEEVYLRALHRDGSWRLMDITGKGQLDESGEMGVVLTHRDITERKRSEEKIISYQEQLRSMASEISFVEERERHKIATALHDQVGQPLAMAGIKLEELRQALMPGNNGGQVAEILDMINHAIRHSRSLTFELSPPILYELGLEAAVCSLAERFQKEHGIRIDCSDDHCPKPLSEDMRTLLFQGVRELLVNAVKHARPRRISISCQRAGTDIRVIVENDGDGFATAEGENMRGFDHGFGLFSLRERLKYLGGSIAIKSVPGQCTQISLTAPLAIEEK